MKVREFKDLVHRETSAPRADMAMAHKGKILADSAMLLEYCIKENDSIVVFTAKSALPDQPPSPKPQSLLFGNPAPSPTPSPNPQGRWGSLFNVPASPQLSSPFVVPPSNPMLSPSDFSNMPDFPGALPFDFRSSTRPSTIPNPPTLVDPLSVDPGLVSQLTEAGFNSNRATRALLLNRKNPELAMEWLLDHMEDRDPTLDSPITPESFASMLRPPPPPTFTADPAAIQRQLQEMGFSQERVQQALAATNGSYEAACNWLLSREGLL
ncbi:hypothetical protein Pelo_15694 [Pelomyxa schiedti]|nr:hypothetical protein Pelo_15694 [Pelomyxa schiedti]